jgi:hypothetical protein
MTGAIIAVGVLIFFGLMYVGWRVEDLVSICRKSIVPKLSKIASSVRMIQTGLGLVEHDYDPDDDENYRRPMHAGVDLHQIRRALDRILGPELSEPAEYWAQIQTKHAEEMARERESD